MCVCVPYERVRVRVSTLSLYVCVYRMSESVSECVWVSVCEWVCVSLCVWESESGYVCFYFLRLWAFAFFYQMPSNSKLTHHLSTLTRLFLSVFDVAVVVVAAGSLKVCFKNWERQNLLCSSTDGQATKLKINLI